MKSLRFVFGLVALLVVGGPALGDARPFTFAYESTTMPKGGFEYEQWVTWKTHKNTDSDFDQIDFRHELEYGVTDNFQLALYVSDWTYKDGSSVSDDGSDWKNVAVEAIYNLANPVTDPVGLGLYGEVKIGDEKMVLEGKLLVDKQIGNWVFAWNGVVEAKWEGKDYEADKGEFKNIFGVSYSLNPHWRVGSELIHKIDYDDWSAWGDHVVYLGPNISYTSKRWWITITPTLQLTDIDGEPDFITRMIFGIYF